MDRIRPLDRDEDKVKRGLDVIRIRRGDERNLEQLGLSCILLNVAFEGTLGELSI